MKGNWDMPLSDDQLAEIANQREHAATTRRATVPALEEMLSPEPLPLLTAPEFRRPQFARRQTSHTTKEASIGRQRRVLT
jgi:hypothetical protein